MRAVSGTGGGRKQRGRESIENELRSLSAFYRWGTPQSPGPSSPWRPRGGGASSIPSGSVTKRSRRRRRRGNLLDLDNISIASVDSSWQEAANAAFAGFGGERGVGEGRDGSTSPIARRCNAPIEKKHEATEEREFLRNTPPRVRPSDRLLSEGGGHTSCGDAETRLAPALQPGSDNGDVSTAPTPTALSSPLLCCETGGPEGAEHLPAVTATCQQAVLTVGGDCGADVGDAGSALDGADDFPGRVAATGEDARGEDNREPDAEVARGKAKGDKTGRVLPEDGDLAEGCVGGLSESDSDGAGVGRWNIGNEKRRGQAVASRRRRVILEDDSEEEEEEEVVVVVVPAEPQCSCDSLEGDDSADELAAEDAIFAVLEGAGVALGASAGIDRDSGTDRQHDPTTASSSASATVLDVGQERGRGKSKADGGKERTVVESSHVTYDEYDLPLECEKIATTAVTEASTSGRSAVLLDGGEYSYGERSTSDAGGLECCGSDSGSGGYCSPDAAEEWNMGTSGDVGIDAGRSSEGDGSMGSVGGNTTGREGEQSDRSMEPGASGDRKSRSLATGALRMSVSVFRDSGDNDDEVRTRPGNEISRRALGKTSRRRVVSKSFDSDSSSPREEEEGEGSSWDGIVAAPAAVSRAPADDIFLDAEEQINGGETRETGEEEGSDGEGSFVLSGSEGSISENISDDDAGQGSTSLSATGRRFAGNRPRRQQARRVFSDDEQSTGGASDIEQEGVNVTNTTTGKRNTGLEDCCSALASRSSDDDNDGPRHLRTKPPVASSASASASELSDDASSGGEDFEEPTGSSVVGQGGGREARRGRTAGAAVSSPSSSSSWSPVSRRPAGRSLRITETNRTRQVLASSDDSDNDGGGDCDFDSPLPDGSPLASPVTRDGKNASGSGDLAFCLSPSPRQRQGARGKGARAERDAGVGGEGAGKGTGDGSRRAQADAAIGGRGSRVEELRGAAFLQVRDSLTAKYFAEFNEGAFGGALSDVGVTWSTRLQSTAGVTKSLRRTNASGGSTYVSVVELSTKVLDSDTKLRQTLLHELCHAAAWVIDHKSKPPHGSHFWAWANRAKAAHPGVPVTTCHTYTINYKYRYVCVGANSVENGDGGPADAGSGCGAEIGRHSKSINVQTQVCGRCRGRLALFGTHNIDGKLTKPRAATGFSLFVKERYAEVKKALPPGTKQQEVMKEMSRQWAARGNRGGRTPGDDGADVRGGECGASLSPRVGAGSSGLGNSAGAKGGKTPEGIGRRAAASTGDKENVCLFDLT